MAQGGVGEDGEPGGRFAHQVGFALGLFEG